jgi:3-oxoadipate enol-lactonase
MTSRVTRSIAVDGGIVQVDSEGDGPDLVIIHSLLTGPEAFDTVTGSLARDFTVHRLYLPGFGASTPRPRPGLTIADLAAVVASTIAELGTGPGTTVLGNGLGSFIALSLAIGHAETLQHLIVANTGPGFPEERKGAFTTMSRLAEKGGMTAVADVALARIFPPSYLAARPDALDGRRRVLEEIDPGAFAAACRALASLDLSSDLPGIHHPTLVIAGEIDQTTPPEMGRAVAAAIPRARFEMIPQCGHCPQLEHPEALRDEIEGFLVTAGT